MISLLGCGATALTLLSSVFLVVIETPETLRHSAVTQLTIAAYVCGTGFVFHLEGPEHGELFA